MAVQNILMPQLGESVTEGTIERWLVQVGDRVNKYDPIAEVNTDKVNAEVPSSFSGTIKQLVAREGEKLPVGAVVCTIELEGPTELPLPPEEKKSNISSAILNAGVHKPLETKSSPKQGNEPQTPKAPARYSPAVLALAAEHDIDLALVEGSGMEGRITRKDVQAVIASGVPKLESKSEQHAPQHHIQMPMKELEKHATVSGDIEIPVTPVRRAIANNMLRSTLEVPHAWMMIEVDVTELVEYRDSIKGEFKQREGYNLTYFAFFVKAVAQALKEYPMMNSMWAGEKIIQKKDINLSIAVATEDALFVPVIKQVDEKSIKGVAKDIFDLSQLVRNGKLKQEHMQGGTFTVNNTGSFGSIQSMGIINYPQAAILQVEKIVKKPVLIQGNMIAPRHIVNLCLSLDHRVLDGLICGKFLNRVKEILENVNKKTMSVY
ncbi:dihydrolipoamide acetyltransferase family protein [Solibacillus sp. FSL H8-0538]|uniref:dihydrolipoamide acetyltransferase family protein n=1 Tax=Solibacillus sp. FSL H8-0538 TaxID=2921400 RepID=UPI0030F5FB5D